MAPALRDPLHIDSTLARLEGRPAREEKLVNFVPVNFIEHREKCDEERKATAVFYDNTSNNPFEQTTYPDTQTSQFDMDEPTFHTRLKKMFTVFPYRDPIYLVAVVFAVGSLDLVINAFFDLLPRTIPSTAFETEDTIAIPTTVLIGSILFFVAGIFDTFGALNADRGTLDTDKEGMTTTYRPALLGSPEFTWIPSRVKFWDLTTTNLAFQAGLMVLFGGVTFMFAGIVDFPGLVPEEDPLFGAIVFSPQVIHGALFLVANIMLALSGQERWYIPNVWDADWQGAFLNAVGGFWFMMAGLFLFWEDELASAISAMAGSWAFLIGSLLRWYVVMEF